MYLNSALNKKTNKKTRDPGGKMKQGVKIQCYKTQQFWWIEEWTGGWTWSGLCDVAALVAWMLWSAVAWVQWRMRSPEPFLTPLPKGWQPTLGEERLPLSPLYPGSNQKLLAPHSSFTQEQSQVKAGALTNLLWSFDSYTSWCKTSNTFLLRCTKGGRMTSCTRTRISRVRR